MAKLGCGEFLARTKTGFDSFLKVMMKNIQFLLPLLLSTQLLMAQRSYETGVEYMRPIGRTFQSQIAGMRTELFQQKNSFSLGLVYNFPVQSAYSVSRGFGLYAGYRYNMAKDMNSHSPFLGGRLLFSLLNFESKTKQNSLFITPLVEGGYHFLFNGNYYVAPSIAFGHTLEYANTFNSLSQDVGRRFMPSVSAGFRFR